MDNKTLLTWGAFILTGLLVGGGATYYFTEKEQLNAYQCGDVLGLCFKLSAINTKGLQTYCYWNESAPTTTKYGKYCAVGWKLTTLKPEKEFEGIEVNLPDEKIEIKTKWADKKSAEDYVTELKQNLTYEFKIVRKEQKPFSDELEVFWRIYLIKEGQIVFEEELSSTATEGSDYDTIVNNHAKAFADNWKPNIKVVT